MIVPPVRIIPAWKRALFVTAGLLCVGLAGLGAVLPGLPTTPWVLLASYCFARSSPRLYRWLRHSPFFGRIIRDWEEHRGVRLRTKLVAVTMVVIVVSLSLTFGGLPDWVKCTIAGLAACGMGTILFVVPTVKLPDTRNASVVSSSEVKNLETGDDRKSTNYGV